MTNDRKKKVLITGASGFIGSFLVKEALRRDYEVWAGVRLTSSRANLQDERIRFISLQLNDLEVLSCQLSNHKEEYGSWDYVIHNAGLTKALNKADFYRVNAEYTNNLIKALQLSEAVPEKFLLMSSLSTFGGGNDKTYEPIRPDSLQVPETEYGKSKLEAENYVRHQTLCPFVILRPTGVYGPGDKDYFMEIKSIQSGFDFAVGSPPQQLTFIYVKDLAEVAFVALESGKAINREYFVADGEVYSDEDFARMIQEILGKKHLFRARIPAPLVYMVCVCSEWIGKLLKKSMTLNTDKYRILKQRNWICDASLLQDELDFRPTYTLREGLTEAIAWYRENKWLK
ncbi:NAD(P)-dependent oxidoreductase [Parabacteroides sp. OttesenSCG-928-G21]|nr:NAD(P)-dependent oxidoreductase [Parabacteroides sp. OttesenSCG-928-G21]